MLLTRSDSFKDRIIDAGTGLVGEYVSERTMCDHVTGLIAAGEVDLLELFFKYDNLKMIQFKQIVVIQFGHAYELEKLAFNSVIV